MSTMLVSSIAGLDEKNRMSRRLAIGRLVKALQKWGQLLAIIEGYPEQGASGDPLNVQARDGAHVGCLKISLIC